MLQMTELHTAMPTMKDVEEGLACTAVKEHKCVRREHSFDDMKDQREFTGGRGCRDLKNPMRKNTGLKRNKSISLNPCKHNVLRL